MLGHLALAKQGTALAIKFIKMSTTCYFERIQVAVFQPNLNNYQTFKRELVDAGFLKRLPQWQSIQDAPSDEELRVLRETMHTLNPNTLGGKTYQELGRMKR